MARPIDFGPDRVHGVTPGGHRYTTPNYGAGSRRSGITPGTGPKTTAGGSIVPKTPDTPNISGAAVTEAATAGGQILGDMLSQAGAYQHTDGGVGPTDGQVGLQVAGGALKGAASGASMGSMVVPPIGTIVGGAVGGLIGGISSYLGAKKQQKQARAMNRRARQAKLASIDADVQVAKERLHADYKNKMAQRAQQTENMIIGLRRKRGQQVGQAVLLSEQGSASMAQQARSAAKAYKQASIASDAGSSRAKALQAGARRQASTAEGRFNNAMRLMNVSLNQTSQKIAEGDSLVTRLKQRAERGLLDKEGNLQAQLDTKASERFARARAKVEDRYRGKT